MNKTIPRLVILTFVTLLAAACEKDPGTGGNSTIFGKVFVKDYNSTFNVLEQSYYGPEIWVYIVYGDDRNYGDRIQTGYDGTYEFKYLRPGKYQVYAYSKDSTLQTLAPLAVTKEVEITKKKQEVEVPDLVIFN